MKKGRQGEWTDRAVAPVVAVVLMIAIVVVLSGFVAAFALGIGTGGEPVLGAVDGSIEGDELVIEVTESGNIAEIELRGAAVACGADPLSFTNDISSGSTLTSVLNDITDGDCAGETITVVGFNDDEGDVILDRVDIPE